MKWNFQFTIQNFEKEILFSLPNYIFLKNMGNLIFKNLIIMSMS